MICGALRERTDNERGMLRMADQPLKVNCPYLTKAMLELSYENRTTRLQTPSAEDCVLVQEPASPAEERRELVRIDDKIKNERYRGQHEHQVSHGAFPALTC
jgi:hypothetical protein